MAAGHWAFSNQFQYLVEQNRFWLARLAVHFQWDGNQQPTNIGDSRGGPRGAMAPPAKFYSDCSIREYRSIIYKCAYSDCSIREY